MELGLVDIFVVLVLSRSDDLIEVDAADFVSSMVKIDQKLHQIFESFDLLKSHSWCHFRLSSMIFSICNDFFNLPPALQTFFPQIFQRFDWFDFAFDPLFESQTILGQSNFGRFKRQQLLDELA